MTDKVFSPGEVLTAADVNDYLLNRTGSGNAIINGAFDIWQRCTSFTTGATSTFTADRWSYFSSESNTSTISRQEFTPGAAPVAGYESAFFLRYNVTAVATPGAHLLFQRIEDVRTFAGQTATVSFWAKANASQTLGVAFQQAFGSGGSTAVTIDPVLTASLTTEWQRFTATISVPSISGKTIGAGSNINVRFNFTEGVTQTIDIWGVQLEAGPVATPFKRNANSLQGELAGCQRYYQRYTSNAISNSTVGWGVATSTTSTSFQLPLTTTMRATPNSIDFATSMRLFDGATSSLTITGFTIGTAIGPSFAEFSATVSSGLTQFRNYRVIAQDGAFGFIGLSAEL